MQKINIQRLFSSNVLGLSMALSFLYPALAETESATFTLENNTDRPLLEFYASPPSSDDWEDDILGTDILLPGQSVEITIDDGREDCLYDFKGVLGPSDDGSVGEGELIQSKVQVCDGETYEYSN